MSKSIFILRKANYIFYISALAITTLIINCTGAYPVTHDPDLSIKMRSLPYHSGLVSELRIYRTTKNLFLSDFELSKLIPVKSVTSAADIDVFFKAMAEGRISSQNLAFKNLHYKGYSYHLIGLNAAKTKYGYLKIRISTDKNLPAVAQVQPLNDTNSFEIMKGLPEILEPIDSNVTDFYGIGPK